MASSKRLPSAAELSAWARGWVASMVDGMVIVAEDETLDEGGSRELAAARCDAVRALVAEMRSPPAPAPATAANTAWRITCNRCGGRCEWMTDQPSGQSVLRCLGCGDGLRCERVRPTPTGLQRSFGIPTRPAGRDWGPSLAARR